MTKKDRVLADVPWWGWLIFSCIVGFVGGVLLGLADYYATRMNQFYYAYIDSWAGCFYSGVFFICVAVVLDIFMLKALITEAHVRAMEIFYGKKREIAVVADKKINGKKTRSWPEYME